MNIALILILILILILTAGYVYMAVRTYKKIYKFGMWAKAPSSEIKYYSLLGAIIWPMVLMNCDLEIK